MNWAEVLTTAAGALGTLAAGVGLGAWLRGKPPASRKEWEQIKRDAEAHRATMRREALKNQGRTP